MIKQLFVMIILSPVFSACQTTDLEGPKAREAQVLESEKGIAKQALDNGKPQVALETLRPLLKAHPDDPKILTLMGLTQLALKNKGPAVRFIRAAYKIDGRTATGLNLSAAYIEAGEYKKATSLLQRLIKKAEQERYSNPERIYHNLGLVAAKEKRPADAQRWFQKALEENPTFFLTHLELGKLHEQNKRPTLAIKSYQFALDYCKVCYEPLELLTRLYVKSGRMSDARLVVGRFLQNESTTQEDRVRARSLLSQAQPTANGTVTR